MKLPSSKIRETHRPCNMLLVGKQRLASPLSEKMHINVSEWS